MTRTYLITGGAGNLACQLSLALAEFADQIVLFDRADGPVAAVAPCCTYVQGDLSQKSEVDRLIRTHRPTVVLHLASLLSASCETDRNQAWQVNADGAFALLEASLAAGVQQVFFPSSLAAYGGPLPNPLPEDHPQWPTSLYGVTKVAVERLGLYYHARHGLDFRCLRLPVVVSRFAPPGAASAYSSRAFVESVQQGGFTFKVREATRVSTVYVKDCIRGIVALIQADGRQLTRRVYNIHAIAPSASEIAAVIRQHLPQARLCFESDPQVVSLIESWPAAIQDDSARRDWGWQPAYDLERLADDLVQDLA